MGFDAQGAVGGASQGSAMGPWGALAGGIIGGFFGGKPKIDPYQKKLFDLQFGIANQLQNYGDGVPLSSPQEQGALAEQRAQLGEEQRNQQNRLFGAMPVGVGTGNVGDLLNNLSNQQVGQRMNLQAQALQNSLENRRQALLQASGAGQAAFGPAWAPRTPVTNPAGSIASLLQQMAYSRARNGGGAGAGTGYQDTVNQGNDMGGFFGAMVRNTGGGNAPAPVMESTPTMGGIPAAIGGNFGNSQMDALGASPGALPSSLTPAAVPSESSRLNYGAGFGNLNLMGLLNRAAPGAAPWAR